MVAVTTNYLLQQPTVNADADVWGGYLNNTIAALDKLLAVITTGGSANAYTLTTGQTLLAYATGQAFRFKANFTNSGAATINVDGIGAKALTKNGAAALASGDIVSGQIYTIAYDSTQFQVFAGLGASALGAQPLSANGTAFAALTFSATTYLKATGAAAFSVVAPSVIATDLALSTTYLALAGGSLAGNLTLSYAFPTLIWHDTGAGADAKNAYWTSAGGVTKLVFANDVFGVTNDVLSFSRSGATPTSATFSVDAIIPATGPTSTLSAGFRGAPATGTPNSAYGLVLADAGGTLYHDEVTARTWTIPANASVAFPIGTVIIGDNTGNSGAAGVLTLSITSDTLRRGDGTAGTGSRTIAALGVFAIRKTKSTEWVITGSGIT